MNPIKLFLKLSLLQKILFFFACIMFVLNLRYFIGIKIFDNSKANGVEQSMSFKISDVVLTKFDNYKKIEIKKENFNSSKFDSVNITYSSNDPILSVKFHTVNDFLFSKLWFCKMLVILKLVIQEIILLLVLLIVLAIKKESMFNNNTIKILRVIASLLLLMPIITFVKEYLLENFLHENLFNDLSDLSMRSSAQNFFYPLFFALIIFMLIDVFKKGNKIEQENDLTI
jgi:hypothetical protein